MTVAELKALLSQTKPGEKLTLTSSNLPIDGVKELFDAYLPNSTLTIMESRPDTSSLTLSGRTSLQSLQNAPVLVTFTTDAGRQRVRGIRIDITAPGWEINVSFLTLSLPYLATFGFSALHLLLLAEPGEDGKTASFVGIGADFPFRSSVQSHEAPKNLYLTAIIPRNSEGDYTLEADFERVHLADLMSLKQFAPNGQFIIPTEIVALASQFDLTALRVVFSPLLQSVVLAVITIRSNRAWQIIPGKFDFAAIDLHFSVGYPRADNPLVSATLGATLAIGEKIKIATGVTVPKLDLLAELQQPVQLQPIIDTYLPGVALTNFMLQTASFGLNVRTKEYLIQLDITGKWELISGVALQELAMMIAGAGTNRPTGRIGARFHIGDARVLLSAGYQDAETGWLFEGSTLDGSTISTSRLADDIKARFGIDLPQPIKQMRLTNLQLRLTTGQPRLFFTCTGSTKVADVEIDFTPTIDLSYNRAVGRWEKRLSGTLVLKAPQSNGPPKELRFRLTFDQDAQSTSFSAAWEQEANPLQFADIAGALGFTMPPIPSALDLALTEAALSYDFSNAVLTLSATSKNYGKAVFLTRKPEMRREYYFVLGVDRVINLSNLPLIGQELAKLQTIAVDQLQVIIGSQAIDSAAVKQINAHIPAGYPTIAKSGTASAVSLSAQLDFGSDVFPINLGLRERAGGPDQNAIGPPASEGAPAVGTTAPADSDGTAWFNIQKRFGPITFHKIGVRYEQNLLWFLLNTSLSVGGLTIDLQGLAVGSPLSSFAPAFQLSGMGIDYRNLPLEIGGAFLRGTPTPPGSMMYSGAAVVQASIFSLVASGSYADLGSKPSMFIFGALSAPLGGLPFFFVTGLAGGFGFNSSLRLPHYDEVYQFPFVAGLTNPSVLGGENASPLQVLSILTSGPNPWVSPQLGQYWIAAGIMFTICKLVDAKALVVVEFGQELALSLTGFARASFPPAPSPISYAQVELALQVLFQPARGLFAASAGLTPNSYLLDPAAKLTGGFAFFIWFGGSGHEGDFVLTVGGYHANFDKPAWYPAELRVGFQWAPGSTVSISGGAYLALTPSAIMAGGALDILFHTGNLKAWFTAHADLILWYRPFHFVVDIGVRVGVSYRLDLGFTAKTFSAELGANLTLWGPPVGGTVTVHWVIISFTIDFGQPRSENPPKLQWQEFAHLLPAARDAITISAVRGLVGEERQGGKRIWIVRASQFQFTTQTAVPSYQLFVGTQSAAPYRQGERLNILPMQMTDLASQHRVTLRFNGQEIDLQQAGWAVSARSSNVPKALWGRGKGDALLPGDQQLVKDQLVGFALGTPPAVTGASPGAISVNPHLQYAPLSPAGKVPIRAGQAPSGPPPQAGPNTIRIIESEIMSDAVKSARDQLYAALQGLGVDPGANGPLGAFAKRASNLFRAEPLIISSRGGRP